MKKSLFFVFILGCSFAKAQKIDSIFVNLYTDSLKKGTYNYINIDGHLSNGRWLPLDSSHLTFTASAGKFFGNNLWISNDFNGDKVSIQVVLRKNPAMHREFDMFIKRKPDDEKLKSVEEIMNEKRKH